jgi:hypothetical protein
MPRRPRRSLPASDKPSPPSSPVHLKRPRDGDSDGAAPRHSSKNIRAADPPDPATIRAALLTLLSARAPGKTACPSEIARALDVRGGQAWRGWMDAVRAVAAGLAEGGVVCVSQRGVPVPAGDVRDVRGPIRLALVRE